MHDAVYFGDGKKHLSWDYLKALTPFALAIWYMDDGCFTLRSKGVQERTQGGTGRIEICVEAMSPGSRERLAQLPAGHLRPGCQAPLPAPARRQYSQFTTRPRRSSRSWSLLTCIPRWSTTAATFSRAVRRQSAVRCLRSSGWLREDPGCPRQAADALDEQVRHRGRGKRTSSLTESWSTTARRQLRAERRLNSMHRCGWTCGG